MGALTRRQFIGAAAGLSLALPALPAHALSINPRSAWAGPGYEPKGPLSSEDVRFLIVHHSASNNGHTSASAPGILRSWFDFHTGPEKGWNDVAYNFVIDNEGVIWEARQGSIAGAVAGDATGGNQGFSQLVCIIGDYNAANPAQASLDSLIRLLGWLADRHGLSTAPGAETTFTSRGSNRWPSGTSVTTPTITGHRTMSKTTCPGDKLYTYVAGSLMGDVQSVRTGGTTSTTVAATTSTTAAPTTTTTTTATRAEATTTAPTSTTTTTVPSTTLVPTTTTTPSVSSTAAPGPATTVFRPTTTLAPSPTSSIAVAAPPAASAGGSGRLIGVGLAAAAVGGLIIWRQRRMG